MDCVRGCLFSIEPNRLGSFLPEMRETENKQNSHIIVNCAIVSAVFPERKKQDCLKEEKGEGRLGMACPKR